jgi:gamma-glutamylcysteine synthetase
LTFRGTIEFRSVCCQPIRDAFTVAAFHLGLSDQVGRLNEIIDADGSLYHHGYGAPELRRLFNRRKWPDFISRDALWGLLASVLGLAREGLVQRGLGEEKFLEPLFARAEELANPALKLLAHLESGGDVEDVIADFGELG